LQGHIIDAYHAKFFPSGIVILTGGADCCLKIWSAETGDNPVTLKGHTGSIQDTSIVDRGRNIISVAK
jgi:proteasomal ATPase-associated factor 1